MAFFVYGAGRCKNGIAMALGWGKIAARLALGFHRGLVKRLQRAWDAAEMERERRREKKTDFPNFIFKRRFFCSAFRARCWAAGPIFCDILGCLGASRKAQRSKNGPQTHLKKISSSTPSKTKIFGSLKGLQIDILGCFGIFKEGPRLQKWTQTRPKNFRFECPAK